MEVMDERFWRISRLLTCLTYIGRYPFHCRVFSRKSALSRFRERALPTTCGAKSKLHTLLVAVGVRLVGTFDGNADVVRLTCAEGGQFYADFL